MEKYESQNPQTFKMKIENFFYYYKWRLLAAFLIICSVAVAVRSCMRKDSIDLYVLYMTNGAYSDQDMDALAEKLKPYMDDLDGDGEKRVQVITIAFSDVLPRTDQTQESSLNRLVSQIASGPALFYVFDEENYTAIKDTQTEVLADIEPLGQLTPYVDGDRFNATQSGFLNGITFYEQIEKDYYFGMRTSAGITEEDSRFAQIEQCQNVLRRLMQAYS